MDNMLYVSMSGARQIMIRQAINNNNLANLNTTGFKADMGSFSAMPVYGPGEPVRVYAQSESMGINHSSGSIQSTGIPLDIAVKGSGFIAVQDIDGEEAYTRNGNLDITDQGLLITSAGQPVLGEAGPITLTAYESVQIGTDGTVTVMPLGQAGGETLIIDRIKLVNPEASTIKRNERGLFVTPEATEPASADVTLAPESLETSNVSAIEALVTMIDLSRQFEAQIKMMDSIERNDSASDQLLKAA